MPLLPVLIAMETEGITLCEETLKTIGNSLSSEIDSLKTEIFEIAGEEFNLNSPKQLGIILFEVLALVEKPKKTKTGQYATNEQTLSGLAGKHRIAAAILEYRQLSKLISTYIDALPPQSAPKHSVSTPISPKCKPPLVGSLQINPIFRIYPFAQRMERLFAKPSFPEIKAGKFYLPTSPKLNCESSLPYLKIRA